MWSWLAESKDTEEVQIQRVNYKLYTSPCVVQGSTVQTISLRNYQLPSGERFSESCFSHYSSYLYPSFGIHERVLLNYYYHGCQMVTYSFIFHI